MLNAEFLSNCEEFFGQIANEDGDLELSNAIDSLREFLERDVDGWTNYADHVLARAVQCRMMEIWGLVSNAEKQQNPDLEDYYNQLMEQIEEVSGYETDDVESESDYAADDYDEEEEFE